MKRNLREWLTEYARSHQNKTNKLIHNICVPTITFSILGILWSMTPWLTILLILVALGFYISLSLKYTLAMLVSSIIIFGVLFYLPYRLEVCLVIFVVSWILQFIGHHLEGEKPSFFKDIQFLLIGPLWVLSKLIFKDKLDLKSSD